MSEAAQEEPAEGKPARRESVQGEPVPDARTARAVDVLPHERLKAYEGRPAATAAVGKDLVNAPMIRHWCEAVGDTSPAYRGPDAIAPPTIDRKSVV